MFNFDQPRWAKEAFNRIGLCYHSGDSGCHSMDTEAPESTLWPPHRSIMIDNRNNPTQWIHVSSFLYVSFAQIIFPSDERLEIERQQETRAPCPCCFAEHILFTSLRFFPCKSRAKKGRTSVNHEFFFFLIRTLAVDIGSCGSNPGAE